MRIQQLENQLRQLTGQNEELQYRNRQLEERLRVLQGGAQAAPGGPPAAVAVQRSQRGPAQRRRGASGAARPALSAAGPAADCRAGTDRPGATAEPRRTAGPAPWRCLRSRPEVRMPRARRARSAAASSRFPPRRPSARRADAGRGNRSIWRTPAARAIRRSPRRRAGAGAGPALTTLPPSATPKDEFDLGIGYMQRKDYALAEETMRNFAQKYPQRSPDLRIRNTGSARVFSSASNIATPRKPSSG